MKLLNALKTLVALFIICIASCQKGEEEVPTPTASFNLSKSSAELNEVVTFTNTSKNATSFAWDFGDGNTSPVKDPTHSYSATGIFTVTLQASGAAGNHSASKLITIVFPAPVAGFTIDKTTANAGEIVTFTNTSQNASSFAWDFGDGSNSTEMNPAHSYSADGTFTINLTVTGDGGTASSSKTITITKPALVAKWILIEGRYNGTIISNISGYFEFITNEKYYAKIDKGTNYARSSSYYTVTGTSFKCTMPSQIILNGMSMWMSGDKSGYTSINMNSTDFAQIGGTAIGYDRDHIDFSIAGNVMTITSSNGLSVLKYQK